MEPRILLIADFASVDAGGKLNIIGAFNRIYVRDLPVKHGLLYVVIRLDVQLGEFDKEKTLRVIFYDQDSGERWNSGELKFTVPTPVEGHSVEFHPIIAIQNLELTQEGTHEFRIFINDDLKGSIALDVLKIEAPTG